MRERIGKKRKVKRGLLVEAAQQWATEKGATEIQLDIWEFAAGPLHFYERLGYRTLKRHQVADLQWVQVSLRRQRSINGIGGHFRLPEDKELALMQDNTSQTGQISFHLIGLEASFRAISPLALFNAGLYLEPIPVGKTTSNDSRPELVTLDGRHPLRYNLLSG